MIEYWEFILGITGTLIMILIAVIGYLYKIGKKAEQKIMNGLSNEDDRLHIATNKLDRAVNRLEKSTTKLETNIKSQIEICGLRHNILVSRMEQNEENIKRNGAKIYEFRKSIEAIKMKIK